MHTVTVSRSDRAARLASEVASFLAHQGVPGDAWRAEGVCIGVDPELFFPHKGEPAAVAVAVCARCPVRLECLTWALCHNEKTGIWGGAAERTRRLVRRILRESLEVAA